MSRIPTVKLESGQKMPVLGFGTWKLTGDICINAVTKALESGYTHIDTADVYGNHNEVGEAIKGHDRSGLFITTKVWRSDMDYEGMIRACDKALSELGTDYIDLYLLHWPNDEIPLKETMKGFRKLLDDGKVRSIGISNFDQRWIKMAIEASDIPISVNQVEFHPYLYQKELLEYCNRENIVLTAYCPVARGHIQDDPVIGRIANDHCKNIGQVALRWLVQHGITVIPKSSGPHIKENMDIFDWKLTKKEMEAIDSLNKHLRIVNKNFTKIPLFDMVPKSVIKAASNLIR